MMTVAASSRPAPRVAMFCSAEDNVGQTTTLVNVALTLADKGLRVLIVDARRGEVRARHYLSPLTPPSGVRFPTPPIPPVGETGVVAGRAAAEQAGSAIPVEERYRSRTGSGGVDLIAIGDPPALARLAEPDSPEGRAFDGYDHVLIDAPRVWTDAERTDLARLPHVVVACFTLNSWSIEGAADLARAVRARAPEPARVTVVAVGIKADTQMQDQLRTARAFIRTAFARLADDGLRYLEIPYDASYALAERLPAERPSDMAPALRPYYVQLAEELVQSRSTAIRRATVVYTPRHHRWAEWITAQLECREVPASALPITSFDGDPPGPGSALLVISPTEIDRQAIGALARLSHPNIRLVLVDDLVPAPELSHHEQLDLRRMTEPEAVIRLHQAVHLPAPAGPPPMASTSFPRLPERTNLRPRDPGFVGREEEIAALGEALSSGGGACVLLGQPGIGKSELTLEFCHRFGGDYDIVWWLPATSAVSAREALLELADRLDVSATADVAGAVLTRLASPDAGRWLLVYDDAPGGGELDGLIPPTSEDNRHVVVTSRDGDALMAASPVSVSPVSVPPFSAAESRSMLSARVPELSEAQAQIVGQTVGYVPLTVSLAAAWLAVSVDWERGENRTPDVAVHNSVGHFSSEFHRAQNALAAEPGGATLTRAMLEITLALLSRDPGADIWQRESIGSGGPERLLEACAILADGDVTLDLLKSPVMQHALARADAPAPSDDTSRAAGLSAGPTGVGPSGAAPELRPLSDPFVIDVALWSLARHGLIGVDLSRSDSQVRQHRVLRELIMRRMGARLGVHVAELRGVLSRYSPQGPAGGRWDADAALDRYFTVLRPWEDRRPEVRQWVLSQLRRLISGYDKPSLERALELGEQAELAWHGDEKSAEYLRLLNLLAQAHRELNRYNDARRLARRALRGQRAVLGMNHPRSLLSGDAYGSILVSGGQFRQARSEVRRIVSSLALLLGPRHPATLQAQHNLAFAEVLTGNPQAGLELLHDQFNQLRAIGGENNDAAWGIADSLAFCHRVLGQHRESFVLLKGFLRRRGVLDPGGGPARDVLRAESGLAVAERRLGDPEGARERDERVLAEFIRHQGENDLATVSCRSGLAADLHCLGKHADAVEHARQCLQTLIGTLTLDHPYSRACAVNLSVYQRAAGDHEGADAVARESYAALSDALGATHPWTLAAATSVANLAAAAGEPERAAELERSILHGFDELGLSSHPDRRLVARNLAASLAGRRSDAPQDRPAARLDIDLELPGWV